MEDKVVSPEKAEEAKLKARYPNLGAKPGGSDLLRKRLQKGVCFYAQTWLALHPPSTRLGSVLILCLSVCPAKVL